MPAGVKVEGLSQLVKDLQSLGIEVQDLKEAFSEISGQAAKLAASFAPKRSGALAASIRGDKSKNRANVKAGGARVPYAGAINYGWPRRSISPAHFMQRADDVMRPRAAKDIEAAILRLISERNLG